MFIHKRELDSCYRYIDTMIKSGNKYVVSAEELNLLIVSVVEEAIARLKNDTDLLVEELTAEQVRKELNVGKTFFWQKLLRGEHAIPFVGTPKKRTISRPDFENWKKNCWGK